MDRCKHYNRRLTVLCSGACPNAPVAPGRCGSHTKWWPILIYKPLKTPRFPGMINLYRYNSYSLGPADFCGPMLRASRATLCSWRAAVGSGQRGPPPGAKEASTGLNLCRKVDSLGSQYRSDRKGAPSDLRWPTTDLMTSLRRTSFDTARKCPLKVKQCT